MAGMRGPVTPGCSHGPQVQYTMGLRAPQLLPCSARPARRQPGAEPGCQQGAVHMARHCLQLWIRRQRGYWRPGDWLRCLQSAGAAVLVVSDGT
jgi:hypothetical protein